MESKELILEVAKALDAKKAADIVVIDIAEKSSFADYFLLASGRNERQIAGLADEAEDCMAKLEMAPKSIEGKPASGWILMDYGDVIINILTKEMREKYNIERVWGDCEIIAELGGEESL
jgi:ribosome-associated protein